MGITHLTIGQLLSVRHDDGDAMITEHLRVCAQCRATVDQLSEEGRHPPPGDLAAFVTGDLDERVREGVEAHLRECQFCQAAQRELTHEPRPGREWRESTRRGSAPVFWGIYTGIPDGNGNLRFVSEKRRERFIAAAEQLFQQHKDRLSGILKGFDDLENPFQKYLDRLGTEDTRSEGLWRLQDIPELDAAEASMRELRDRALAAREKLSGWESAMHMRSSEPWSFATSTVSLSLGAVIAVEIRGTVKTSSHLTVDARWRSGTPGRNIDVRAISLSGGATESGRTDVSGRAELRLESARYKIELEHEVHGGGGLILDLSLSPQGMR